MTVQPEAAPRRGGKAPSPDPQTSLSTNTALRFAADGMGLVLGAVSAIVTARWLGPADKGTLAALVFVTNLLVQACHLGLGDSAMVWLGQRRASVQQVVSSSMFAVLVAAVAGSVLLVAYANLQLPLAQSYVVAATAVACIVLPFAVAMGLLSCVLNSQNRIPLTSGIWFLTSATSAIGTVVFVGVVPLSILGGMLGSLIGSIAGFAVAAGVLWRQGVRLRPKVDLSYLGPALRFGAHVQASYLLTFAAARVDLLLVYSLAGRSEAGTYSVALTLGTLAGSAAAALSYAAFPRLASLRDDEATALTARIVRTGLAVAIVSSVLLAAVLPVAIPVLLGSSFEASIVPALLLVVGGVFWSGQWLLSRAAAAQGDASLLLRSFLVNFLVMIGLDVLLIPSLGSLGAAYASVAGPAVGFAVCLRRYTRKGRLPDLVPRPGDLRPVLTLVGQISRAVVRKLRRTSSEAAA